MDNNDQITIQIEFVDADPAQPDPARRSAVADAAMAALRSQGYAPQPVATGAMGGDVYEVVRELAQGAAANKDIVLALITGVAAPIVLALAERLKRTPPPPAQPAQPAPPVPQTVIIIAGSQVVLDDQMSDADSLLQRLLTEDPGLAQRVTPQTTVTIRTAIPAAPRPRRR